ncbi:MAG: copper chaperone PCu(A)C [Phenylobacterium sp.]|nr:copper chaperone PCu(A)C [Phenylobacterium sp.]
MPRLAPTIFALGLALSGGSGHAAGKPAVAVADPWCRATPVGAPAAGCFMPLTSTGPNRLTAVQSPASARGEIHTMDMAGGVMRMRELSGGLALPAGAAVALKPGGLHVMLVGLKAPLKVGERVRLTLRFETGGALTVEAPVRAAARP